MSWSFRRSSKGSNLGDKEKTFSTLSFPDESSSKSSKAMKVSHSTSVNARMNSSSSEEECSSIMSSLPAPESPPPPPVPPKSSKDLLSKQRKTPDLTNNARASLNSVSLPTFSSGTATTGTLISSPLTFSPPLTSATVEPPPLPHSSTDSYKLGNAKVYKAPLYRWNRRSEVLPANGGASGGGRVGSEGVALGESPVVVRTLDCKLTLPSRGEGTTKTNTASTTPSSSSTQVLAAFDKTASAVAASLQSYTPPSSMSSSQTMIYEKLTEFSASAIHPEGVTVRSTLPSPPTPPPRPTLQQTGPSSPGRGHSGLSKSHSTDNNNHLQNGDDSANSGTINLGREHDHPSLKVAPQHSYLTDASTLICRLFNNPLYSDLELYVDGTTFHVHRGILAEHCGHFQSLFENARRHEPVAPSRGLDCSYVPEHPTLFSIMNVDPAEGDSLRLQGSVGVTPGYCSPSRPLSGVESRGQSAMLLGEGAADSNESTVPFKGALLQVKNTTMSHPSASAPNAVPTSVSVHSASVPSFSLIFVMGEHQHGYKAHDFAAFLQLLYGILSPEAVQEVDLLSVFRISYLYDVPGLVTVLGQRIFQSLVLSASTWPSVLRFSERYRLNRIKQKTLGYASRHREIWALAVEMLDLGDFKTMLRGIRKEDVSPIETQEGLLDHKETITRAVKDELLMMYLLVHYQNGFPTSSSLGLSTRQDSSSSHMESVARRSSIICPAAGIQRQLQHQQQQYNGSAQGITGAQRGPISDDTTIGPHGQVAKTLSTLADRLPVRTERAEKARSWMKRFKHECGWDGQVSHLD